MQLVIEGTVAPGLETVRDAFAGNFDRAAEQLESARRLATSLGDEAALTEVDSCLSGIEDERGDRVVVEGFEQRR